jgi:hypothetical protein
MAIILVRYIHPDVREDIIRTRLRPAQQLAKALRQTSGLGRIGFKAGVRRASPYGEILVGALTTAGAVAALYKTIGIFLNRHRPAEVYLRIGKNSMRIRGHSPRQEARLLREFRLNPKAAKRGQPQTPHMFWAPGPKGSRKRS